MPPSRRRPPSPPPPRTPRLPPLRFSPVRAAGSVDLDRPIVTRGKQEASVPFVRWDRFIADWVWNQGEHVTSIGPTGSGKTVLNRELLSRRRFVIVLGVKNEDQELYGPFQAQGYELVHRFEPEPPAEAEHSRILFVPRADGYHGKESRDRKGKAFRAVLNDVYDVGRWTVYADDIQYMSVKLGLGTEFEELWMIGRSEKVSLVASSQEPVDIPVMAYSAATHLFLFKNPDLYRARRMAELTGVNREVAEHVILNLPDHEFLYIDKRSGKMVRSMVIRH
jgi:hypothetical protein